MDVLGKREAPDSLKWKNLLGLGQGKLHTDVSTGILTIETRVERNGFVSHKIATISSFLQRWLSVFQTNPSPMLASSMEAFGSQVYFVVDRYEYIVFLNLILHHTTQ